MPAYYAGLDLGFIFIMNTAASPNSRMLNAYPGANGLESVDLGSRGGHTLVEGGIVAASAGGLAAVEAAFRGLQVNGLASVLVDTLGTAWPEVILDQFVPIGPVRPVVANLTGVYYCRHYRAEFLHLI